MGERKRVRIVPYGERKPLYAAYAAAHAEADRIGGTLSDDLIVQAAVKAYEKALAESGRLLPPGGEVREEWVARWTPNAEMAAQGYEVELIPPGSRQRAEQYARRLHESDDGVVELLRQRTYIGPWEVVSDTSEAPDG